MRCETVISDFQDYLEELTSNIGKDLFAHLYNCEFCRRDCQKLLSTFPDRERFFNLDSAEWQELKLLISNQATLAKPLEFTLLNQKPLVTNCFDEIETNLRDFASSPKVFMSAIINDIGQVHNGPYWDKGVRVATLIWLTSVASLIFYGGFGLGFSTDTNKTTLASNTASCQEKVYYIALSPKTAATSLTIDKASNFVSSKNQNLTITASSKLSRKPKQNSLMASSSAKKSKKPFVNKFSANDKIATATKTKDLNCIDDNKNGICDKNEPTTGEIIFTPYPTANNTTRLGNKSATELASNVTGKVSSKVENPTSKTTRSPIKVVVTPLNANLRVGQSGEIRISVNTQQSVSLKFNLQFNPQVIKVRRSVGNNASVLFPNGADKQTTVASIGISTFGHPEPNDQYNTFSINVEAFGAGKANLKLTDVTAESEGESVPIGIFYSDMEINN